jgi:GNAT superfamily N-acetyltransferase
LLLVGCATVNMPAQALEPSRSSIAVRAVRDKKSSEIFLHMPWTLGMPSEPNWVPPLLDDYRRLLDPKRSAFLKHGEVECYLAYDGKLPVGRISVQIDRDFDKQWPSEPGVAFFGFFECKNDPAVARALFGAAEAWARSRGRTRLRGPFTLDSKGDMGVLIDGFDTVQRIGMPYNRPYVGPLIESVGYAKVKDVFAWWFNADTPIDPLTKRLADRTRALPNVTIRTIDLKQMPREVDILRDIYNEAWSENWGFTPFTQTELEIIASEYKMFLDPEIVLIAEVDGKPAAICLAVPDLNELVRDFDGELMRRPLNLAKLMWRLKFARPKAGRLILLGVKAKYRASRKYGALVAVLYEEVARRGRARGYLGGELGWTLEDNDQINRGIERMGARKYKTFRVYERML